MAETQKPALNAVKQMGNVSSFWKRELNGASFLSLEHVAHMILAVLVPVLLAAGFATVFGLWTGKTASGLWPFSMFDVLMPPTGNEALHGLGLVASLAVLVPLLVLFDRRTHAEWPKREGYTERAAYKVPIYFALAVLAALKLAMCITLLYVLLSSIMLIGVRGAMIGDMYLTQFVPALVGLVIFAKSGWYVFRLAKGREYGFAFSNLALVAATGLVVALLITAPIKLHSTQGAPANSSSEGSHRPVPNYINDNSYNSSNGLDNSENSGAANPGDSTNYPDPFGDTYQ